MAFIAAAMCVRIYRSEAQRRARRGVPSDEMTKALLGHHPTTTTDAGDDGGDSGDGGRPSSYYRVL